MTDGTILRLDGVSKNFGGVQAVHNLSFDITHGSTTGLIGPNGAGKTTAFNIISGLVPPDSGQVYYLEKNITDYSPVTVAETGIGRTFQDSELFDELTVLENLLIASSSSKEGHERAEELLDLIEMTDRQDALAENLSYGQSKLLDIARAFMLNPDLILLDEPLSGINPSLQTNILDTADELQERYDTTYVLIEHDMSIIMDWCERVLVMEAGELLADGTPEEIQDDDAVLEAYFGEAKV